MKIQKSELARKINRIKGVVPRKPAIPILQGILVKDGYLVANNTETAVKTKIEGSEGECFIIPTKAFDLINNLPDGEVEITADGNHITIMTANIKNKFQTMDPIQFPEAKMPDGEERKTVIDCSELLRSIKRVSYAVPDHSPNAVITSMCLQAKDGYLNFVGIDGRVMAWDKVKYDGDFTLLLPKNTIERLQSIGIEGSVSIRSNKLGALFVTEEYEIYTRLVAGEYFRYKDMFDELPLHTVVAREELLDAIMRAKMCTVEKRPVRLEISDDIMNVSIRNETTDYNETIALQEPLPEKFVIGFDAQLVIETLKAFDCENIIIQLRTSKAPMIIKAEDSDFMAIVCPINLGEGEK